MRTGFPGSPAAGPTGRVPLQLLQRPQQAAVALVALVVLRVEQQLLGVTEEPRDSGETDRQEVGSALPVGPLVAASFT